MIQLKLNNAPTPMRWNIISTPVSNTYYIYYNNTTIPIEFDVLNEFFFNKRIAKLKHVLNMRFEIKHSLYLNYSGMKWSETKEHMQ